MKRFSRDFYLALAGLLVVAALAGMYLRHRNRQNLAGPEDLVFVPKETAITPEIRLLQSYVRIDTSNPPGNETAGARLLMGELEKGGIRSELIESAPGRGNVYARLKGRRSGDALLLLSHIDVVPASPGDWTLPPFAAGIRANMMYGRGTLDMKSITICHLQAFLALARSRRQLERDVVFLATADEEGFGPLGMRWLLEHRPDVFEGVRYAINEGGVTQTIAEKVVYFGIETGSKQFVAAELSATDRRSLERARIALEPYFASREPDRLLPEVRDYFARVAPYRKEHTDLLRDVGRTISAGRFWLLDAAYRELLQNNVRVSGPIRQGDGWIARAALLNLPDEDPVERIEWLRSRVAPWDVKVRTTSMTGPTAISSAETPFFAAIEREIQAEYGAAIPVGPMILPGITTDCRYLRPRGVQCYGMWPFPVSFYQTKGIHGANESIRLDWFMAGVRMTTRLVGKYATVR